MADEQASGTDIWTKLNQAITSAVQLRVVTYVGEAKLEGSLGGNLTLTPAAGQSTDKVIYTSIDLIAGDVTSVVPERFWTPENQAILEFHRTQVGEGKAIVDHNLRLIAEIGEKLIAVVGKGKSSS